MNLIISFLGGNSNMINLFVSHEKLILINLSSKRVKIIFLVISFINIQLLMGENHV
jgi:hypothetical protein